MINRAASYDKSCMHCNSNGFASKYDNYKDIDYYTILLGTEHGSKTVIRICETCLMRLYREYEGIRNEDS